MSKRTVVAAVVGFVGGLTVIVGTVLPWLSISAAGDLSITGVGGEETVTGLSSVMGILLVPLGVLIMVAAAWLWAGSDVRKSAGLLGSPGAAAFVLATSVLLTKSNALGLGFGLSDEGVGIEIGVYVMLVGGLLAVVAAIVAVLPERAAAEPTAVEPTPTF